jgi:hypothetical protein
VCAKPTLKKFVSACRNGSIQRAWSATLCACWWWATFDKKLFCLQKSFDLDESPIYLYSGWNRFARWVMPSCLQDGVISQVMTFHPCFGLLSSNGQCGVFLLAEVYPMSWVRLQSDSGEVPNLQLRSITLLAEWCGWRVSEVHFHWQYDSKHMRGRFNTGISWWSSLEGNNWLERVSAACGG